MIEEIKQVSELPCADDAEQLPVWEEVTPLHGPETLELPVPGGVFEAPWGVAQAPKTPLDAVEEKLLICPLCKHAWRMRKYANVRNLKPDGTPFSERESYCMYPAQFAGGAPLPLADRHVLECNQFIGRQ